ncbi:MAG: fructosamine kinase family protein [Bacteroidales bacterium]
MLHKSIRKEAENILKTYFNEPITINKATSVSGGSINDSWRLETNDETFFLKSNKSDRYPGMFEKEAKGLQILRDTRTVYIPEIIGTGKAEHYSFIVMEYIHPGSRRNDFWSDFAYKLAQMHQNTNDQFGLDHDNYMGSLPQYNKYHENFYDFFILERLEPQLRLAHDNEKMNQGHVQKFEQLYKELKNIIPEEKPALVHGDFYNGNLIISENGTATIVDPAIAYSHREVDIAMSTLFGDFDQEFYNSYNAHLPLENGWEERIPIFNLYLLLIHVNLFGIAYLSSVERIIKDF